MEITKNILTHNDCYKEYDTIKPKGIMVHSTGVNNPKISRYSSTAGWNKPGVQKCVHFMIGKTADGSIGCEQHLPLNCMGWHSGSGSLGWWKNANHQGYIGFEICEAELADSSYFKAAYKKAVELCVYLCERFGWDPKEPGRIICHSEGHASGIASNHGDVMHWFPMHKKSMDTFRADVAKGIAQDQEPVKPEPVKPPVKPKHWADSFLQEMKDMHIMDGTRPDDAVTRGELAAVVHNYLRMKNPSIPEEPRKPGEHWAASFMREVKTLGIMDGTRPDDKVTRGELAAVVHNMMAVTEA